MTITTLVLGLPRQVVVQRCRRGDVDPVLRGDGAVWPPLTPQVRCLRCDDEWALGLVCIGRLRDTRTTENWGARSPRFGAVTVNIRAIGVRAPWHWSGRSFALYPHRFDAWRRAW
jgi:hypothetical protein